MRLVEVNIIKSLELAKKYNIYAYDAYYLETAKRLNCKFMTLDKKVINAANDLNLNLEVIL